MARCLIWLVRRYCETNTWIDVPKEAPRFVVAAGGELAKVSHWGLAKLKQNEDNKKRTSGIWKPTKKGIAFVHRGMSVPKYVFIYNNEVSGFSEEQTDVVGALGKKFDYSELMAARGREN
jgi:hypothetical protein